MNMSNGKDSRDSGLIAPRNAGDGAAGAVESTAEIIRRENRETNPEVLAEKDAQFYFDAGVDAAEIINLICLRINGLSRALAVSVVNRVCGTEIDAATFKIDMKSVILGDAPVEVRRDPYLARLLEARNYAEKCISAGTEMSLSVFASALVARHGIKREHAEQIIDELVKAEPQ
jgi:hypothetical protein